MTITTSTRAIGAHLGIGNPRHAAVALFGILLGRVGGRRRPTGLDGLDDRMLNDIGLVRRDGEIYAPLDPWIERR